MNNILTVKNLAVSYGNKTVIDNINFTVSEDDFLVIFGVNGSGKSSLLKTLLYLKSPSKGEITFEGGLKRAHIGYLPQITPVRRTFRLRCGRLCFQALSTSWDCVPFTEKRKRSLQKRIWSFLISMTLKGNASEVFREDKSKGCFLPELSLLPESFLFWTSRYRGLDPVAAKDFYDAISLINKSGICIIMVSHDTSAVLPLAKHVLDIGNHTAQFFGTAQEYIKTHSRKDL